MVASDNDAHLYRALLGEKNQAFYLSYFRRADERGYTPVSWNWPALLIPMFWFLYRKQYRWAAIVFFFPMIALVVSGVVDGYAPGWGVAAFYTMGTGFLLIWLPLHANGIYYRWARQRIDATRTLLPAQPTEQIRHLEQTGGVNANLPLIVAGTFMLISMLMGALQPAGA